MKNFYSKVVICICMFFSSAGCTTEYPCDDVQIQPVFVHYTPAETETFILRKYTAGENFRTLLDTFVVRNGYNAWYNVAHDTTSVYITDGVHGIKAGYDWQVFIPSRLRTLLITNINSENKTGKRGKGIFSMDPGPNCVNKIFSAQVNTQTINFPIGDTARPLIYINY